MATIDLGKIKQVFRGTYNNSTAYVPDDLVVFTDGSFENNQFRKPSVGIKAIGSL